MNKKVLLKEMVLINFKGIKDLKVDFGDVTTIAGANATGKSTVFDAFTWCMFGKDSNDRTDSGRSGFSVKTVDSDGNPIEKLEHEVSALLEVNGEELRLTRTLTEDWVKPRGKAETELKGNTTHYLINGIEVKQTAYKEEVANIIEEQLFKLITNPAYFLNLDWQKQREILLTIAGGVTYEEVAVGHKNFIALLAQLSGKYLTEYKEEIAYRKKKIQAELDKCPIEINTIENLTPKEEPDYPALESDKNRLIAELEGVDATITNVAETARKHYEKIQAQRKEINDLRTKQQDIVFAAKQAAQKEGFEKNAKTREAKNALEIAKRESSNYSVTAKREITDLQRNKDAAEARIKDLQQRREAKLAEWEKRNADEYHVVTNGLVCPIYKTLCSDASVLQLDASAQAKAKASFEEAQEKDLNRITEEGKAINQLLKEAQEEVSKLSVQIEDRKKEEEIKANELSKRIADLEAQIEANPEVTISTEIDTKGIPEFNAIEAQISTIAAGIEEVPTTDTSDLTAKKKSLNEELDEVKRKLNLRTVIETNKAKKAEVSKREKELAQQLADLENTEFTIEELNTARMDEVERRVNSKFQTVRFRMFEQQINGGKAPACTAMVNGVKYSDLNTAGKINAGLDIINTLCLFHEVSAPVFIDNAESINNLFPVGSQLIKLVVTTDKVLTISKF